jgi:hypothetical protein
MSDIYCTPGSVLDVLEVRGKGRPRKYSQQAVVKERRRLMQRRYVLGKALIKLEDGGYKPTIYTSEYIKIEIDRINLALDNKES